MRRLCLRAEVVGGVSLALRKAAKIFGRDDITEARRLSGTVTCLRFLEIQDFQCSFEDVLLGRLWSPLMNR